MTKKVRRGVGLLVLAALAALVAFLVGWARSDPGPDNFLLVATHWLAFVAMIGSVLGGLALIAWGLLRD